MLDAESDALWLYSQAGVDPETPVAPAVLASALGFRLERHSGLSRLAALQARERVVYISTRARPRGLGFAITHELAEWHLRRVRYTGDDVEFLADHLAGALIAPGPAVRLWLGAVGRHLGELADAFATTQSIVALRLGEVTGSPLALVTPRSVHVRGDDSWCWGTERDVRRAARELEPVGVERLPVTDAPRRCVLAALP